jgi:hypothetical protein
MKALLCEDKDMLSADLRYMKINTSGGLMYKILLTVFLLLSLPVLSHAAPAIHFSEVRHDFGSVEQNEIPNMF